jgi:hypothetical protein
MSSNAAIARQHFATVSSNRRQLHLAALPVALLALWPATPTRAQSQTPPQSQTQPSSSQPPAQPSGQSSAQPASQGSSQSTLQTVSGDKPQSLADAARANSQKDKPKAKRVYTGDDMASIPGNISVVGDHSSSSSADRDSNESANTGSSSQGNSSEAYWRGRARAIKDQIAATDQQIASVKAEIAKSGAASFDTQSGLSQGVIIVHDHNAEVKELEDRKQSLEHQLDELGDEIRKAGGDSGWAR